MYSDSDILTEAPKAADQPTRQIIILSEVLEVLGRRSFVPVLALPALLGLFPSVTSPILASICGLIIATVAFQMVMGLQFLSLPRFIAHRYSQSRFAHFITRGALELNEWLDETPARKIWWLLEGPFAVLPNVILLLAGLAIPALVIMGLPTFLVCTAILIYCISITLRDGRYVIFAGLVLSIASISPVLQLAG